MQLNRRHLIGAAAAFASTALAPAANAQPANGWPARPIRLVSPYGAGGANDISARILGDHMAKALGQAFVVENKPGAGTRIANEYVARAAPDGYTVLYAAAPYATAEALYGKLSYDPRKDLRPIAFAVTAPIFLVVNAQSGFKTVKDLLDHGKRKPEGLTFGSPGAGSQPHLAAELLLRESNTKGLNVHFRGDAPAYTELLAGRIDATLTAISTALPHVQAGKLRVLAVASAERSAIWPDAPTLVESGYPKVVASGWYGFMTPGGLPDAIAQQLERQVLATLADADVRKKLLAQGLEAHGLPAAEFARFMDDETRKWTAVIQAAHIQPE